MTILTRTAKGAPLTYVEMDANLTELAGGLTRIPENVSFPAAPSAEVVAYESHFANTSDPAKGAGAVGLGATLNYQDGTVGARLSLTPTVKDFGAKVDGVTVDSAALDDAVESGKPVLVPVGMALGNINPTTGVTIYGMGRRASTIKRKINANLIEATIAEGLEVRDLALNADKTTLGFDGHVIAYSGSNGLVTDVDISDFGSTSGGGGAGIVFYGSVGRTGNRIRGCSMTGNAGTLASGISYGWIFEDTKCGFASEIYASTIKNYAHELKNSATYNLLSGLIAQGSGWAVGYGQDTGTGPSKNVLVGLVSAGCDGGFTAGYGAHNLVVGMLHDNTGAPNISGTSHLARFESTNYNAIFGALGIGSYVSTVHHAGNGNYVQVASHDTTSTVVSLLAGVSKNCTEIAHPGARTSILAAINDASGNSMRGSSANPVWCNATGERVGSISGLFRDRLGVSGAILNANHYWIKESDQYAINVFQTPGNSGDNAGIAYGTPASGTQGLFIYSKGSSDANDYWFIRVGNANTYRFYSTVFRPETNDAVDLGNASSRWKNLFLSGHISRAVGANVASATTITPSGPIFHVTGVTAIATINLPYTGFTGSIKIIPDGIFTTTTAGNIGLASTAVVGKVLEMTYDGTKWWPSY